MRLLAIRHAIAQDREVFARKHDDDDTRPLTPRGRKKMRRGAVGLQQIVPEIEILAASPLKRALQTAEIVARVYGDMKVQRVPELAPGTPLEQVVAWIAGLSARGTVAVVGHEPDLSRMVCALLASSNGPFLEFRKGAACLLEFTGPVAAGAAVLQWFLAPRQLRRLGADRG